MMKMESEMLRLISSPDRDAFTEVVEELKAECQKQGNERLFYSAWGNQSTYEATHQNYMQAEEIANQIADHAEEQNSYWGNYIALHTKARDSRRPWTSDISTSPVRVLAMTCRS